MHSGRGHCLGSLSDSLLSPSSLRPLETVRLLPFCFHLITDVKGLQRLPRPLAFSLFLTFLHYSFIYSNYPHHVNLSLPLTSRLPQTHFFPRKNDSMLDSTRLLASANYSVNNATFLDRSERNKRKYKLPRKLAEHDNWCIPRVVLHIDDSPFTKLRGRIRRGGWFPWFEEGFEL